MEVNKLIFELNPDIVDTFQSDLNNLAKVSDELKIKIYDDEVMIYAKAGPKRTVHAFKSYIYDRDKFMINQSDENLKMDFIIINSRNFARILNIITKKGNPIGFKIEQYEAEQVAHRLYISDNKIDLDFLGGNYLEIRDFDIEEVRDNMDVDLADFNFELNKEDYEEIKRLASLNKNDVVNFRIRKGNIEFFDTRWNIKVGEVDDYEDMEWTFDIKYFKTINNNNKNLNIYVFNQSLLIKQDNEIYMIALQLAI